MLKLIEAKIDNRINCFFDRLQFKKTKKNTFIKKVNSNFNIIIIFEKSSRRSKDMIYINPIVGIYDKELEEIYEILVSDLDLSTNNDTKCTALISMGYLLPNKSYTTWQISSTYVDEQINENVDNLLNTINKHALPYLYSLNDRNTLLYELKASNIGFQMNNQFKIPIIMSILGEKSSGINYVRRVLFDTKPTPKNINIIEPKFSTYNEVLDYFKRDKDAYYYFRYYKFAEKYQVWLTNGNVSNA